MYTNREITIQWLLSASNLDITELFAEVVQSIPHDEESYQALIDAIDDGLGQT